MELTDVKFWDDYWTGYNHPGTINPKFSYDRCLAHTLKSIMSQLHAKGEVLEVGCAPGKWLAFMAQHLGLKPSVIEYSEAGMNATLKNFQELAGTTENTPLLCSASP